MNEIISSEDVMKNLRDRIKATILEAIPEEKWDALIKSEMKGFFEGCPGSSFRPALPSTFSAVVADVCRSEVTARCKAILESPEWRKSYDGLIGEKLQEIVTKSASEIINAWCSSLINFAIQSGIARIHP